MRTYVRTVPDFFYSITVCERDHTKVERIILSQLRLSEYGPAMAGPAGPVPAPMVNLLSLLMVDRTANFPL